MLTSGIDPKPRAMKAEPIPSELQTPSREEEQAEVIRRLEEEPFVGRSNATKIVDLFQTGTCARTLDRFARGLAPLDGAGEVRTHAHARARACASPQQDHCALASSCMCSTCT